jgi:glycosyltransferase involved in cell wall biosynthesis
MMAAGATMPAATLGPVAGAAAERVRLLKFVTLFAIGGTERQVVTLASGLDASRFHLHLACLRRTGELLDRDIFRSAPPVEYCIRNLYNGKAFVERLKFAAYLRHNRIQIVHTYSFYPNVFAIVAARLARTPVVIASIRDMGVYCTPLQLRVQRVACRLAHQIVVNAEAVKQWLLADGYDGSKITVIPNGVELSRFRKPADGSGLRHELGLPEGCPLVAVVSRLSPSKGLEDFLRAAAILAATHPATRFLIVGQAAPADEGYRAALAASVGRLGLEGRVVFTGLRLDVPEILSQVSVSVLPSHSEGLSNVLLESMAAGVPVVATRVGGAAEAVENGVTGLLVEPKEPAALAEGIHRLLRDRELARSYGCAGQRRMTERYGFDTAIQKTERLYQSLLKERGHAV